MKDSFSDIEINLVIDATPFKAQTNTLARERKLNLGKQSRKIFLKLLMNMSNSDTPK